MPHLHVSRFTSRSYELDSYRHLNNGVYLGWFEQSRLEWLQSLGFSYDGFADRHQWFVVARTEVDFRRPVHLGDSVTVESALTGYGRSSVRFRQRMTRGDELCAEAVTVMVFSGDGGGSVPIPADFRAAAGEPVTT
jgi:YbgC/YbaW family acyl-CoA thioester hydrolase